MARKIVIKFWFLISIFVVSGIIFILNIFHLSSEKLENIPLPKVKLGLDLVGGIHIVLKPNFDQYMLDKYSKLANQIAKIIPSSSIEKVDKAGINIRGFGQEDIKKLDPDLVLSEGKVSFSDEALSAIKAAMIDQSLHVIRNRVDAFGTKEVSIYRASSDLIVLQIPNENDVSGVEKLVGAVAKLNFHIVRPVNSILKSPMSDQIGQKYITFPAQSLDSEKEKLYYVVEKTPAVFGEDLSDARVSFDGMTPSVAISFNSKGGADFARTTAANVGNQLAIVLDGKVISAPNINEPILSGNAVISGKFDADEVKNLAISLKSGALPTTFEVVEQKVIGPEMGRNSIVAAGYSILCGLLFVLTFMLIYYKKMGFCAVLGLFMNMFLIISTFAILDITLTLPGIAGILLTLGMAVDANVLIYEKMKEFDRSKTMKSTLVERGFDGAMSAITDSNITTILAAVMLVVFGSTFVKSFAIALIVGIVYSFFTAVVFTRAVAEYMAIKGGQVVDKNFL